MCEIRYLFLFLLGGMQSPWSFLFPPEFLTHFVDKCGWSYLWLLWSEGFVFKWLLISVWELQPPWLLSFVLKSPEDILLCILDCVIIGGGRDTHHPARRARALSSYMMADTSILAGTSLLTLWTMFARGTKIFTTEGFKWNIRYCYLLSKHMILRFTDTSSRTLKYTACLHLIIINIICI